MSKYDITCEDLIAPTDYPVPDHLIPEEPEENEEKEEKDEDEDDDRFNDLEKKIVRDTRNYVSGPSEICTLINHHDYEGDVCGKVVFYLTCGIYAVLTRRVIPDGHFGHYMSSGRHMFVTHGIKSLYSCTDYWLKPIPMDDQQQRDNHKKYNDVENWGRSLGSKYLVTVPENCLGGAHRIGVPSDPDAPNKKDPDAEDGQFVLLKKGRHVLDAYKYKDIQVVSLERPDNVNKVILGPITILYLKDGELGGAFDIWEGVYKVFHPGAPLLLHKQYFKNIDSVKTTLEPYHLGPYTYITVQEGKLAGAYNKQTGLYQIFKPGQTYRLHTKDWMFDLSKDIVNVSDSFQLGPYCYITVLEGYAAGVYHKKTGKFITLNEGGSYRLNTEDFEKPIVVKIDSHKVVCGPLTYLTLRNGTLNGAYKVESGEFIEFEDADKEYRLHEKDFRDITIIQRNTSYEQKFGVFKVITIPEGSQGVFENLGKLEVKEPNYYKLGPQYTIRPMISVNTFTMSIPELDFRTKDGVTMTIDASMVWVASDPKLVSMITPDPEFSGSPNPSFSTLEQLLRQRFQFCIVKHSMVYNRDELLPTKQDIILKVQGNEEEKEAALLEETKHNQKRRADIENNVLLEMEQTTSNSKWGVTIHAIKLEGFELKDPEIERVLNVITEAITAISREKIQGDEKLEQEEQTRQRKIKETDMQSSVKIAKAQADAQVKETEANAAAEVVTDRAKTNANDSVNKATTENAAKVELAKQREEANKQARQTKLDIENREKLSTAEANAQSIKLLAEAEYEKTVKENEAFEKMSKKQFNLQMSRKSVEAMRYLGGSAWRMPDKVLDFYEQFSPLLLK